MNDISYLNPLFMKKLDKLIELCKEKDIEFTITDTYRTEQEQNYLFSKGRLSNGIICTYGQYPNNYHCWGLAVTIETESNPKDIEEIAKTLDLIVTYSLVDSIDIEYAMETFKFLRLTYGDYKKFRLTWDPDYIQKLNNTISKPTMDLAKINKKDIENIQMACNMDGFKARGRILTINGELDTETMEALKRLKIEEGKRYSLVKRIQVILTKLGFNIVVTGKYDKETKRVITSFQLANDLTPNGQITRELIVLMLSKL